MRNNKKSVQVQKYTYICFTATRDKILGNLFNAILAGIACASPQARVKENYKSSLINRIYDQVIKKS